MSYYDDLAAEEEMIRWLKQQKAKPRKLPPNMMEGNEPIPEPTNQSEPVEIPDWEELQDLQESWADDLGSVSVTSNSRLPAAHIPSRFSRLGPTCRHARPVPWCDPTRLRFASLGSALWTSSMTGWTNLRTVTVRTMCGGQANRMIHAASKVMPSDATLSHC